MICASCKQHNPDERVTCWNCGAPLVQGSLGQPKQVSRRQPTAEEEQARERQRVERSGMRVLAEGILLGALIAAAIGAALAARPVLTRLFLPGRIPGQQDAVSGEIVFYILRDAIQGALAGAIVGGAVAIIGGGRSTGWQVGALINALAFTIIFVVQALAFRAYMPQEAGTIARVYFIQLFYSCLVGAGYGWIIGSVVSARLDRWS